QLGEFVDVNAIELSPEVKDIFDSEDPFALLLRPDNYIALISRSVSFDEIRTYLDNVIGL
ncbi:MAG TPA: hypothetical protein VGN90_01555, partial [Pyrinomonadaceae bacterium]|nr:hypothetical protein [Pyrinomonadaceae bacterium]